MIFNKRIKKLFVIFVLLIGSVKNVFSAVYDLEAYIDNVIIFSNSTILYGQNYLNIVQIKLKDGPIGLQSCNNTYLNFYLDESIEPNGAAMYSTLLTAKATNAKVIIRANESKKVLSDNCGIDWVGLK